MTRRLLAAFAAATLILAPSVPASAWDSKTRPALRNLPITMQTFSANPPAAPPSYFMMSVLKEAIGGTSVGGFDDTSINTILRCGSVLGGKPNGADLSSCVPATNSDLFSSEWGWLEIRKSADLPNESEHYLIAKAAASLAGLAATSLFDPFFVRYATQNALIASPRDLDTNGYLVNTSPYLVGQSWLPAASLIASTQAERSISLFEIAELPDFSSSLADWAAGNEICPIPDTTGAFTSAVSDLQACHAFPMVLGAINATHFAPLNQQTWAYYHSLAIKRMKECNALSPLIAPFYTASDPVPCPPGVPPQSCEVPYQVLHDTATEQHECESEAMSYEMFAQHFLEDSWSTGHMWKRWGKANFGDFDADVSFGPTVVSPSFPQENEAPRRATIAIVTAALAGTIHGSKSVIVKKLRALAGSQTLLADYLEEAAKRGGLTDDPLNGPTYTPITDDGPAPAQKNVEWLSPTGQFAGAGDLFWDPIRATTNFVGSSSAYVQQRTQMLKCGAASMLAVYNAGPHAHGTPVENLELDGFDPVDLIVGSSGRPMKPC